MAGETHTQCCLVRDGAELVSWIPSKFAKVGAYVKLKDSQGNWTDGWKVTQTYAKMPSPDCNERSQPGVPSLRVVRRASGWMRSTTSGIVCQEVLMPQPCSVFWPSQVDLERVVAEATSITDVIHRLGVAKTPARQRLLEATLMQCGIPTPHFRGKFKFSDESVRKAVAESHTWSEMAHVLGVKGGGSHQYLRDRVQKLGICTGHFRTRKWAAGQVHLEARRKSSSILVLQSPEENKTRTVLLRRALLDLGRKEECVLCGQRTHWNGKHLTLQIDHIDGNRFDHRQENLRFLCPNCHTQTETYGNKRRS